MKMTDLLPFIEDALKQNKTFTLPVTGTSMLPLLVQGRDTVELSRIDSPLKIGDLPLYRRKDGAFVLHRIVGIENGKYTMCGDNQFILEKGIEQSQLIGIVTSITRDGKKFSVNQKKYCKYVKKMCSNVSRRYPLRRFRFNLSMAKNGLFGNMVKNGNPNLNTNVNGDGNNSETLKNNDIISTGELLIKIIADAVNGKKTQLPENTDFKKIYKLAENHRVTAVVASGILNCDGVPDDVKSAFKMALFKCSARHTAQEAEMKNISKLFSENNIEHCFLKGGKISSFYDLPESRFMLDADIYINKKDEEKAAELLLKNGYKCEGFSDGKDRAFSKPPCINIELHLELKYDYDIGSEYYKHAFEHLVKCENGCELKMTDEDFYVYILSHTAHHFAVAGTGIRNIIDHYYLRKKLLPLCDGKKIENALEETGLKKFGENVDKLCDFWFEGVTPDENTKKMSGYIILSGVYGTAANDYLNGVSRRGLSEDTSKYFLSRLFPDLSLMRERYKILKKLPFLLPFMWFVRIVESFFSFKRIKNEAENASSASGEDIKERSGFLDLMGL